MINEYETLNQRDLNEILKLSQRIQQLSLNINQRQSNTNDETKTFNNRRFSFMRVGRA